MKTHVFSMPLPPVGDEKMPLRALKRMEQLPLLMMPKAPFCITFIWPCLVGHVKRNGASISLISTL